MLKIESAKAFIQRKSEEFERKKNKPISMKDIGRKGFHCYLRTHWTFIPQYNNGEKVFVVERLELCEVQGTTASKTIKELGDTEYRIGYYIVGKNGHLKDRWAWGQFCPMIPSRDVGEIIKQAKENGTILAAHF